MKPTSPLFFLVLFSFLVVEDSSGDDQLPPAIKAALTQASENRDEIEKALDQVPPNEKEGMLFLIANMPERDLKSLSAKYLLENVRLAYQAWDKSPWKEKLPKDIFLNNVLPYASINERRDNWRAPARSRRQRTNCCRHSGIAPWTQTEAPPR